MQKKYVNLIVMASIGAFSLLGVQYYYNKELDFFEAIIYGTLFSLVYFACRKFFTRK